MKIVIASRNRGKIEEIKEIISISQIEWSTFENFHDWPDVEETGSDYSENALAKALTISSWSGLPALADDSGLEVEYLGGKPGVLSARYGGEEGNDTLNMGRLLEELDGVSQEQRGARFVCVAALVLPDEEPMIFKGECGGRIIFAPRGDRGFGYDPIFMPDEYDLTMAELGSREKNRISHRGRAFTKVREAIIDRLSKPENL